jgi:hypothetical protein
LHAKKKKNKNTDLIELEKEYYDYKEDRNQVLLKVLQDTALPA